MREALAVCVFWAVVVWVYDAEVTQVEGLSLPDGAQVSLGLQAQVGVV